jgi:hypothetical protein
MNSRLRGCDYNVFPAWPSSACTPTSGSSVQVGEQTQEQRWALLQGWLHRQAPAPLLVVFETAEDSVHLQVGGGG